MIKAVTLAWCFFDLFSNNWAINELKGLFWRSILRVLFNPRKACNTVAMHPFIFFARFHKLQCVLWQGCGSVWVLPRSDLQEKTGYRSNLLEKKLIQIRPPRKIYRIRIRPSIKKNPGPYPDSTQFQPNEIYLILVLPHKSQYNWYSNTALSIW